MARTNRRLAEDGKKVYLRGGTYCVVDLRKNALAARYPSLEKLARNVGALHPWEVLEKEAE
jgi:UDP-N-acetyl-D-mannosaminuronic acid transferase (WecB/TagA/CpsF family)